jgi:hypothetical protein
VAGSAQKAQVAVSLAGVATVADGLVAAAGDAASAPGASAAGRLQAINMQPRSRTMGKRM